MINISNFNYGELIQNKNNYNKPKNVDEGHSMQNTSKDDHLDKVEISAEGMVKNNFLNTPSEIKMEIPRDWTIGMETLESRINSIKDAIEKADRLNLSFGERLKFLKDEGRKWADDIQKNDPEMFVQWLKNNKEQIQNGKADLVSLPSDFTMKDYYSYVKEPFSAQV